MDDSFKSELIEKYRNADRRLVILDYDGTLVDYTPIPVTAKLSDQLFEILQKILKTPQTDLFIITGRAHNETDIIFSGLSVNIIAEHGGMIKKGGEWKFQINNNGIWKEMIRPVINQITAKCSDSFVEEKIFSLAWHYRSSEPHSGYFFSRQLISKLERIILHYNLKILDGNKVVEILSKEIGKGNAVRDLVAQNNYDFILTIGDDATDEEMFEFFLHNNNAFTIKVGTGSSCAKYKINGTNEVLFLLKQLSL